MTSKDNITKTYMQKNSVFADAFNFYIYQGEKVIKPDDLHELDTSESAVIFTSDTDNSAGKYSDASHQRYRDILKSAVIKEHSDTIYAVLGIENQSDIHYAMPVRNLIYDALQYGRQIRNTSVRHKANHTHLTHSEYLSGFRKEDKLTPVITLVLYFGVDKWDGPRSIHEMLDTSDSRLLKYVQDYSINLIEPAGIAPTELDKFSTSLREVLGYIKYSNDKNSLLSFITEKSDMIIDVDAARVINVMTKTHIDIPDDVKEVNMCKAIEDLINDSRAEGRNQGIAEGRNQGIAEGRSQGIAEGITKGRSEGIIEGISRGRSEGVVETLVGLVNDNLLSIKDASVRSGMSEDAFAAMLRK